MNTIVTNSPTVVNHSIDEIKDKNAKLRVRNWRLLNNALRKVVEADDQEWRVICNHTYQALLAVVHVNGTEGALL